jgi:hypothetical protein
LALSLISNVNSAWVERMQLKDLVEQNKVVNLATLTSDRDLVGEIQTRLSSLGFLKGDSINSGIDHIFGPVTRAALANFCETAHLNNMSTGLFGPTFAQKLINARPPIVATDLTTLGGASSNFDVLSVALKFTLLWEGGFVNNPLDPGGATNRGITQFTYNTYRINKHLPTHDVADIAEEEVQDIYYSMYWKPSQAELAVEPLAIVLFDTAVNFGVGGAIEFLQEALESALMESLVQRPEVPFLQITTEQSPKKWLQGESLIVIKELTQILARMLFCKDGSIGIIV